MFKLTSISAAIENMMTYLNGTYRTKLTNTKVVNAFGQWLAEAGPSNSSVKSYFTFNVFSGKNFI